MGFVISNTLFSFIIVLLLVINLIVTFQVLKSSLTIWNKALYILVIWIMPILGVLIVFGCYYFMRKKAL